MSTHTAAEQACFDTLMRLNTPITRDDLPYPSCLWPIAEAATKAVIEAHNLERASRKAKSHAATLRKVATR